MSIFITPLISLEEREVEMEFVRASGPGGQNVNKVSTAVKLTFSIPASSLPEAVKTRLIRIAGKRVNPEGTLAIDARRFRTQDANRKDALERLVELIRRALYVPPKRVPTHPGAGALARRRAEKEHLSTRKSSRKRPDEED